MKLTLMIEGSAAVIAAVLAALPNDGSATAAMVPGAPAAPFVPPMPANGGGDDDDTGPVNPNAPALDSSGLPWDERIHAKTKTIKTDGTWTGRRGGPKGDELAAIEAQLRASVGAMVVPPVVQPVPAPMAMPAAPMQQMVPPPLPVAAPVPAAPAVMEQPVAAAAPAYSPPPMPVAAPVVPPMPAPEPVAQPAPVIGATLDMAQFMQHLDTQMRKLDGAGAPLVHADYLASITNEISTAFAPQGVAPLTAITDIAANPAMITYAAQLMQRDGRW